MEKFNYFYCNTAISRAQFLNSVPADWEKELVCGEYSYGYYRAIERV